MAAEEAEEFCESYGPLYKGIEQDLERWKDAGISLELMDNTIKHHTTRDQRQKGFAAGFWEGKAYILDKPRLNVGHHAMLFMVYMKALLYLEEHFEVPDVDFVISTIDRPLGLQINASAQDEPVLRFCKTNSHADVLIPIFHFHMKDFDGGLLAIAPKLNREYPWGSKKDVVFGRFSPYLRHFHPNDTAIRPRVGADGKDICDYSNKGVTACNVRTHLAEFAKKHADLDISTGGRIPMSKHSAYKYLVHVDGQGLSSRLDQLLPLNSVVFKEESGYRGFYHHLLEPEVHYLPFWKDRADDILDVLQWAREHDADAKRIAAEAQKLALKFLNKHARACYWYKLLCALSRLLKYSPGKPSNSQYMQYYMPVAEFLQTEGKAFEGGKWYRNAVPKWTP